MSSDLQRGDSEGLRHVEKDVLISKKMRSKAMVLCADHVREFEECMRGRTVTAVWVCRRQNATMKECLALHYNDPAFYEACKAEYLEERAQFAATGQRTKMKRTT